jgi:hypothetical protein
MRLNLGCGNSKIDGYLNVDSQEACAPDPTHVRPILQQQFHLFSKRLNAEWRDEGYANTPLADYLDVDFEVEDVQWVPADEWIERLQSGKVSSDELATRAQHEYNILKEIQIKLRVVK